MTTIFPKLPLFAKSGQLSGQLPPIVLGNVDSVNIGHNVAV